MNWRRWSVQSRLAGCLASTVLLTSALPSRLEAQCTLSGALKSFEPNPPGPGGPRPIFLSSGYNANLALYQPGGTGPYRLLIQESFGYSILELSNPVDPQVVLYHDVRFPINGANSIRQAGDGQSFIRTVAVSADGQRAAFSTGGPTTLNTVAGAPDGNGFILWGDFAPGHANGTVIQQTGGRYIAYAVHSNLVAAIDITTLPSGALTLLNMTSETTSWPGGNFATMAGNYLLYMSGGGPTAAIQVVNASNPGPSGNITAAFPITTITSADFGGRTIAAYTAAVDPADATRLWVLAELNAQAGENSPSYGLLYVTSGLAKVSAGPIWRVPSQAGEVWSANPGPSSALVAGNGGLFVLMWSQRALPSLLFQLYSTNVAAWSAVNSWAPPGGFDIPTSLYSNFVPGQPMRGFAGTGNSVYAYLPTHTSAYVIPMACTAQDAPFVPAFTVNGSASGPVTAFTNSNLNAENSSQRDVTVTASGGYFYSLCLIPCADDYVPWVSMSDAPPGGSPPSSATIPVPATPGNYALKIRVNYTDGTAYWPDPAGVSFIGVNVVPEPLVVTATTNPTSAPVDQNVTFSCSATGGVPPYSYEWRSPMSVVVGTQQTWVTTSPAAGVLQALCTVTDSQVPTPATSSASSFATFTGGPPGSGGPYSFFVLNPCRVLDTRNVSGPLGGPAIQPASATDRTFAVSYFCGIPFDAKAISVNVTATNVSDSGVLSIYRGGGQQTGTNTIALLGGRTRANNAILQLALDGTGTIRVQNTSLGTLDLVIDVNGFFR